MDNLSVSKQDITLSCERNFFYVGDCRYDDTKIYLVEMLTVQEANENAAFQLKSWNFMTWLCSSEVEFVAWKATKASNQYSFNINSR
jgi:hypothetical protein